MLINAVTPEEVRVAIVDGRALENFQVESSDKNLLKGNIYRGVVHNIQPSLNAAFIDLGTGKDAFISLHDVVDAVWHKHPAEGQRPRIESILEKGKELVVQVIKDAEGNKGPAVTTSVSLAGRYLVFTPYDDTRGVSRKVEDDEQRALLKEQVEKLSIPAGGGVIVRTNALGQTKTTLAKDFTALTRLWKSIQTDAKKGRGAKLLNAEQDIVVRVLRDYLDAGIGEVIVDRKDTFDAATDYIRQFMPRSKTSVVFHDERLPLFTKYEIEPQVSKIFDRTVKLASGASIVIDRTEALVAIDVNSGKSNKGGSQEETALNTNLEAADEIARQLRLRDIGGLIVVDFIDMRSAKSRARLEKTMKDAMKSDKARSTVGRISPNGLLEINRQRLQQALHLRTHRPCPTCEGTGRIASTEVVGLALLRKIEAKASSEGIGRARIALHPELADAFQNGRRQEIAELERTYDMHVEVIASNRLHRPEQEIEWFTRGADRPAAVERQAKQRPHHPVQENGVKPASPQPAAALPPSSTSAPAAQKQRPAEQQPAGEGAPRSKRRRRRRRGRDEHPATQNDGSLTDAQTQPMHDAIEEAVDDEPDGDFAEATIPAEAQAADARPGRKRRRGRKRRQGAAPESVAGESSAAAVMPAAPAQVGDEQGEANELPDEPGAPAPARRKRRRRGRKEPAGAAASPATEGGEQEPLWVHLPDADLETARPRRSRRRAQPKPAGAPE
jgi:ribonuclease E